MWGVSETNAGPELILGRGQVGESPDTERQGWIEERLRAALALGVKLVEQVGGLPEVSIRESQVQGEIRPHLIVVSDVEEGIMLSEVEIRITQRDVHRAWGVCCVALKVCERIAAVVEGKEDVGRSLVGEVSTRLDLVRAAEPAPVVLQLIRVHDAPVGRGTRRAEAGVRRSEGDLRQS